MPFERKINSFPSFPSLNLLIIGEPNPERDRILCYEEFWGQKVEVFYCSNVRELKQLLKKNIFFDLIVFDNMENIPDWEKCIEILEEYDGVILLTVSSNIPKTMEPLLLKDNVYCVPYNAKNIRHINCSLRTIRNHIHRNRKYLFNLFDKFYDKFLIDIITDDDITSFEESISRLLSGLSIFFHFEIVVAIMKDEDGVIHNFKNNKGVEFCALLESQSNVRRVCIDFLEKRATYVPSQFLYNEFLRFNADRQKYDIFVDYFPGEENCRLSQLSKYKSLLFVPFQTARQRKWLLIFADKKPGKSTEEICKYLEEKIPFLTSTLSYIEQHWKEKVLLKLHQVCLKTGHVGVWEYEVDTRKIISSGLQALFPYLSVPDELTEWWKYIHPDDRLNFWHAVKPCIQGATNSFAVDHRLLLPGNRLVWVRTIGECISREGKYAKRLVGIGMDITVFMEAEQELRHVKENLQVASEVGSIGLWSWEVLKNEYSINQASRDMFALRKKSRYTLEDWFACIIPNHRELVQRELGETLAKEDGILNLQYPIYYKGLSQRWIHTFGRITARDSKGNPIRISGTHVDITEKKMIEKKLASEMLMSSLYA